MGRDLKPGNASEVRHPGLLTHDAANVGNPPTNCAALERCKFRCSRAVETLPNVDNLNTCNVLPPDADNPLPCRTYREYLGTVHHPSSKHVEMRFLTLMTDHARLEGETSCSCADRIEQRRGHILFPSPQRRYWTTGQVASPTAA